MSGVLRRLPYDVAASPDYVVELVGPCADRVDRAGVRAVLADLAGSLRPGQAIHYHSGLLAHDRIGDRALHMTALELLNLGYQERLRFHQCRLASGEGHAYLAVKSKSWEEGR